MDRVKLCRYVPMLTLLAAAACGDSHSVTATDAGDGGDGDAEGPDAEPPDADVEGDGDVVPTCSITRPDPARTTLNGVPVENGGDRVSSAGSPYQVAVEVSTSVEEGQSVQLSIDGSDVLLTTSARGGVAKFPGVTLAPDGAHQVVATCTAKSGAQGMSAPATYTVDSQAPDLTIVSPANGAHFELVPSFEVCAVSTSADARDLPADAVPNGSTNLCGAIGAGAPVCAAMASTMMGAETVGRGCVQIACPGGPAFDVTLTLRDRAGNPTTKVLSGITCQTNLPSVNIVSPTSTVAGDPSSRVLAASSAQVRKDADAAAAGAQFTVVACTEVAGAKIELQTGPAGGMLATSEAAKTVVQAAPEDGCPAGKPYVARFVNATLPESDESSTGSLTTATRLVAVVTDASNTKGQSPPVDVWVDSQAPVLSASQPVPLCGYFQRSDTAVTLELRMASSVLPLSVTITRPDATTQTLTANEYFLGVVARLGNATFGFGTNTVAATVVEPSSNATSLPAPCEVTIGNPPLVTWVAPTGTSKLGAATDADPVTPGWQGDLKVHTDVGAVVPAPTVQFATSQGNLGAPVAVDASGDATLVGITLPEGSAVQLTATTSDVAARGVGRATITVPVDSTVPAAVSALTASVPPEKRRQTTFRLTWTAPADGAGAAAGYDVRVSTSPITSVATFDAAERVSFIGTPAQPGQQDAIEVPDRYLERDYYFAVAATDAAGNRGPLLATGPHKELFNRTILVSPSTELPPPATGYGRSFDGSQSLNGDAYADLIVGQATGAAAYIYYGSATGLATTPSVTISGPSGVQFGYGAQLIGDIDGDGLTDLAVSAPAEGGGTVYVFKGRTDWPATLTTTNASYRIAPDPANAAFTAAVMGISIVRLNDFDGDGADDFAIAGHRYNASRGYVAIVKGVPAGQTFPASVVLGAGSPRTLETAGPAGPPEAPANVDARFGWQLTNLGAFYGGATSVLAVGAEGYGGGGRRWGAAFAFAGGTLNSATPADSVLGTDFERFMGWSIAPLGPIASPMAVAVGSPSYTSQTGPVAAIHLGSTSTGPFVASPLVLSAAVANTSGDCVFGSVVPGVASSLADNKSSFLGNSVPDFAMSGRTEATGVTKVWVVDGQKLTTLASGSVAAAAAITLDMPADWTGAFTCMPRSGAVRDINNDGYADIAISKYQRSGSYVGQVLVLW